jgi:transposase
MRRHLTGQEASRTIGFLQTGLSQRQVGAQFNVSHTVIGRLWTRYQQTNSVQRRPQNGQPKRTTAHQDRQTALLAKRNRMSSAVTLNREFHAASGVRISHNRPITVWLTLNCAPTWRCERPVCRKSMALGASSTVKCLLIGIFKCLNVQKWQMYTNLPKNHFSTAVWKNSLSIDHFGNSRKSISMQCRLSVTYAM